MDDHLPSGKPDGAPSIDGNSPLSVRLVVGGEYHDYDTLPPELASRVAANGDLRIAIVRDLASLDDLRGIDVLWMHTCHDVVLPPAALQSVLAFIDEGGGLVAMHCAIASFRPSSGWAELIGGIVWGHEPYGTFEARVRGPHPALSGVPLTFSTTDEAYWVDGLSSDAEVLVETTRTLIGADGGARAGFEPQVWTRTRGRGRVFALTFGHDAASQQNDAVVSILHGGLRWAGRRL